MAAHRNRSTKLALVPTKPALVDFEAELNAAVATLSFETLIQYRGFLRRVERLKRRGVDVPSDLVAAIERSALTALREADWF